MLTDLLTLIIKKFPKTADELENIKRQFLRSLPDFNHIPTKKELLKLYHELVAKNKLKKNLALERLLTKRAVRTLSGVAIITVLTKPFPCPGKCIYCPDEKQMPKSYIADEPAAARALMLDFDPYEQVKQRIISLEQNGHPTDKIELIVKGGTWNAYMQDYQYWFISRCFEAANKTNTEKKGGTITKLKKYLNKIQIKNETAKHRIIGLTLETRPDFINEQNIHVMREFGCTRVELGVQTTDDKILKLIKRGHDSEAVKKATALLKNYGFKVDYHLMPQLPGSTPTKDLKMMLEIFDNSDYRPDMIKIYPCTVIKNSELFSWFKKGKYKPYSDKKLIEIIKKFKTKIPRYVRISRLIRDIPGHHVQAGNKVTNLRQVIQAEMKKEETRCNCLRCREVGHVDKSAIYNLKSKIKLFTDKYQANNGTEYFLSCEDANRNIVYAFCRLRLSPKKEYPAFIRELHTYGQLIGIGKQGKKNSQHKGMGKKLLAEAEKICQKKKITKLAVISGIGVRGYYRKLGYKLENGYMVKKF